MKKTVLTNQKENRGITLIALVVTIIVLLILAGISIIMLTGENGLLTRTAESKEETKRQEIIERARLDIIKQQTDNLSGEILESDLVTILNKYGDLSNNGEKTIFEKTLTTYENAYDIKVKEIWEGELKQLPKQQINFTILNHTFTAYEGDTWEDFLNYDIAKTGRDQDEWCVDACRIGGELCVCIFGYEGYSRFSVYPIINMERKVRVTEKIENNVDYNNYGLGEEDGYVKMVDAGSTSSIVEGICRDIDFPDDGKYN